MQAYEIELLRTAQWVALMRKDMIFQKQQRLNIKLEATRKMLHQSYEKWLCSRDLFSNLWKNYSNLCNQINLLENNLSQKIISVIENDQLPLSKQSPSIEGIWLEICKCRQQIGRANKLYECIAIAADMKLKEKEAYYAICQRCGRLKLDNEIALWQLKLAKNEVISITLMLADW